MKKMNFFAQFFVRNFVQFFVLISILTFANLKASAVTSINFFVSGQAMVNIVSQAPDGRSDQDPVELYTLMNVPPKNSLIGSGKAIVTDNRDLNMTCGAPPGRGATCSFVFQKSSRVKINPFSKTVVFQAVGKEAIALSKLFVTNDGRLEFLSTDKMFKLDVSAQEVRIEVSDL